MDANKIKWIYLSFLALIWGSSFILIDLSLKGLTPIQVGAFRILITAFSLILVGYKSLKNLTKKHWFWLSINAMLGTFFPAFLFAYAIDKMDSSVAAILNSLTPLNTLIFGAIFFGFQFQRRQFFGILIGLIGTVLLIFFSNEVSSEDNFQYMLLILIASVGYAFNVNIIKKYLQDVKPLGITTANFILLVVPTSFVLLYSLQYNKIEFTPETKKSIIFISVLAIFGTAVAKTIFNKLVQISTPIFSASVTYLIPIVAVFWGLYFGENITLKQILSGLIILFGVHLVNKVK